MTLSDVELRVLGALIEKERVTPDSYPLSTQALQTACNQRTSRDPVTDYHLRDIEAALQHLRDKGLIGTRQQVTDRVPKHAHRAGPALDLSVDEAGVLSVLMLRGPQTVAEVRTRTDRYRLTLSTLSEYETCLRMLSERPEPLTVNLGRAPGQSQDRWGHTLGVDEGRMQPRARRPEADDEAGEAVQTTSPMVVVLRRLEALEERVAALEEQLGDLDRG